MRFFIFQKSGGELIGARSIAFAFDAFKSFDHFVDAFVVYKAGDTLKVAAATADEFNVADFSVDYVEKNLARASAFGAVGVHFFLLYSTRLS